jgi:hypothetical protein
MNLSTADAQELYRHEPEGVPIDDVLKSRFKVWDMKMPDLSISKQQIRINRDREEAVFITPTVTVLAAAVNNAGITSHGKAQHYLKISKRQLPDWDYGFEALPYSKFPDNFFHALENVVVQCLRVAFNDSDMFKEATLAAWDCANIDGSDPDTQAFNVFVGKARVPFDDDSWEIKKNVIRGKNQKTFVTISDLFGIEHTRCFEIEKGAAVSTSIRLWPYHMSETCYGVSASFSDAGIQVKHKGGTVAPRRVWKEHHHAMFFTADKTCLGLYDIRGSPFRVKTPIVQVVDRETVSISKESYPEWCQSFRGIESKYDEISESSIRETDTHLLVRVKNPPLNEKCILVLANNVYQSDKGWGIDWIVDRWIKI